jgi:hypothetical protein
MTMRNLLLILVVLSLNACMSMGTKVEQDKLTKLVPGKTTYAEVVSQFGKPTQAMMNSDGTRTAIYTYSQTQANAASFVPFVALFARGAQTENTSVTLMFDSHSILTRYSSSEGGMNVGTGLASGQKQ